MPADFTVAGMRWRDLDYYRSRDQKFKTTKNVNQKPRKQLLLCSRIYMSFPPGQVATHSVGDGNQRQFSNITASLSDMGYWGVKMLPLPYEMEAKELVSIDITLQIIIWDDCLARNYLPYYFLEFYIMYFVFAVRYSSCISMSSHA